jgi:hypothetical protein
VEAEYSIFLALSADTHLSCALVYLVSDSEHLLSFTVLKDPVLCDERKLILHSGDGDR